MTSSSRGGALSPPGVRSQSCSSSAPSSVRWKVFCGPSASLSSDSTSPSRSSRCRVVYTCPTLRGHTSPVLASNSWRSWSPYFGPSLSSASNACRTLMPSSLHSVAYRVSYGEYPCPTTGLNGTKGATGPPPTGSAGMMWSFYGVGRRAGGPGEQGVHAVHDPPHRHRPAVAPPLRRAARAVGTGGRGDGAGLRVSRPPVAHPDDRPHHSRLVRAVPPDGAGGPVALAPGCRTGAGDPAAAGDGRADGRVAGPGAVRAAGPLPRVVRRARDRPLPPPRPGCLA